MLAVRAQKQLGLRASVEGRNVDIDTLKNLLELGWPAIVTVFFGYLAIQYINDQRKQIDKLWQRVEALEAALTKAGIRFDDGQPMSRH